MSSHAPLRKAGRSRKAGVKLIQRCGLYLRFLFEIARQNGNDFSALCFWFWASCNFLFGMKRVKSLMGMDVSALGWFRRGVAPWMDLIQQESDSGTVVNSYHRFWSFVMGIGAIALGIAFLFVSFPA